MAMPVHRLVDKIHNPLTHGPYIIIILFKILLS